MACITGWRFGEYLKAQGLLPPNCRRVIIDFAVDTVVAVYYECYGDEKFLKIDWDILRGAKQIRVAEMEQEADDATRPQWPSRPA